MQSRLQEVKALPTNTDRRQQIYDKRVLILHHEDLQQRTLAAERLAARRLAEASKVDVCAWLYAQVLHANFELPLLPSVALVPTWTQLHII